MFTLTMYQESDGRWFFDDISRGIYGEEMVLGADLLLTAAADGASTLTIDFDTEPMSDPIAVLEFVLHDGTPSRPPAWSLYRDAITLVEAWLCPTLLVYFATPPAVIYVRVSK